MLNIVIPMAGRGSRFAVAGYQQPKPLIPIFGKPMIDLVVNNLRPSCSHRFIFICLREHAQMYGLQGHLSQIASGCEVVYVDNITEGAACTVLLAKEMINTDDPLMIANSDQWIDIDINKYLAKISKEGLDGLIMTMWADDPKWSYVRFDPAGNLCEVVEKKVVSNEATVGVYNYLRGADYVVAAEKMITKKLRVNNEFYVAPAYNEMLSAGLALGVYNVGRVDDGMYGLGTPEDLERFLTRPIAKKATNF